MYITFKPNNLGKFSKQLTLCLLGSQYTVPLKMVAYAKNISKKPFLKRGPGSLPEDFKRGNKIVNNEDIMK